MSLWLQNFQEHHWKLIKPKTLTVREMHIFFPKYKINGGKKGQDKLYATTCNFNHFRLFPTAAIWLSSVLWGHKKAKEQQIHYSLALVSVPDKCMFWVMLIKNINLRGSVSSDIFGQLFPFSMKMTKTRMITHNFRWSLPLSLFSCFRKGFHQIFWQKKMDRRMTDDCSDKA